MTSIWNLSKNKAESLKKTEKAGISRSVLSILANRGYSTDNSILEYLRPSLFDFHSPFLFKDMITVVQRLERARKIEEKILIYGDYDADGVSGTALLYKGLKNFGFNVLIHIPTREEGYGLNMPAIEKAAQNHVALIITVDCGITAVEETAFASKAGIDVIITDHHEPPGILPFAVGILNPKVADSGYPFKYLSGVGVAFKLIQALFSHFGYSADSITEADYLDLAALGTIADIVPLVGENRVIVKYGLQRMENTRHQGMKAMLEECGLWEKKLKAGQVSFIVAPRINAAGRMDTARLALNLLLEEDAQDALAYARELSKENYQRQLTEKELLTDAEKKLIGKLVPDVIVLSSPDWHHGVIGIVASRLVERYRRPVFLISEEGETGKGSARGIPEYDVLHELKKQASILDKVGGHTQAAGFTLQVKDIQLLRDRLNSSIADCRPSFQEQFIIESMIPWNEVGIALHQDLEQMAPFGAGNPAPIFLTRSLTIKKVVMMGKEKEHLKMSLEANDHKIEVVAFKKGHEVEQLNKLEKIDIIYNLERNDYLGKEKIQAVLRDYRPSVDQSLSEIACAEERTELACSAFHTELKNDPEEKEKVSRQLLVDFYLKLKNMMNEECLLSWQPRPEEKSLQLQLMKIFEELGLVSWVGGTGPYLIKINNKKSDLLTSLRFKALS